MTAPAGLRHPALRLNDHWLSTVDAVRVIGLSRGCLARKLAGGLVHGHRNSAGPAGAWYLTRGVALAARSGADALEQRSRCGWCRGELPAPPKVAGSARGRHRP